MFAAAAGNDAAAMRARNRQKPVVIDFKSGPREAENYEVDSAPIPIQCFPAVRSAIAGRA
jgi:hypothetical protein